MRWAAQMARACQDDARLARRGRLETWSSGQRFWWLDVPTLASPAIIQTKLVEIFAGDAFAGLLGLLWVLT